MEQLYNQLYKDGKYTKTFEDFQLQFGTPETSEKLYTALNQAGDYTKSFDDFKVQFDIAGKTNDSAVADPNAESGKNDTGSNLVTGSLEPRSIEKNTWLENWVGEAPDQEDKLFGYVDLVSDIYRAAKSGFETGRSVNEAYDLFKNGNEMTDEQLENLIKSGRRIEEAGVNKEQIDASNRMIELKKKGYGDMGAFLAAYWENPSALLAVGVSSLSMMATSLFDSEEVFGAASAASGAGALAGAAGGAVVGSVVPVAGTAVGAGVGAKLGAISGFMSGISGAMETGLTTAQLLQEAAVESGVDWADMSDQQRMDWVKKLTSDKERFDDIKSKALARGITIGGIDYITNMATLGVGKLVMPAVSVTAASSLTQPATILARGVTETAGGFASEYFGQKAAGQEYNFEEIMLEGLAGKEATIVTSISDISKGTPSYNLNGQKMNGKQMSDALKIMDDEAYVRADIKIDNSPAVQKMVDNRRGNIAADQKIDSRISGVDDRAESIKLTEEKQKLENNKQGNKTRLSEINARLDEIAAKYEGSEVDATIEQRKQAVAQAVDNKFEAEFNKNYRAAAQGGKKIGLKTNLYKTDTGYKKAIEKEFGYLPEGWDTSDGVFAGNGKLFVNKAAAKRAVNIATGNQGGISVASHEVLHPIFNALIGDATTQGQFVKDFKKQMTSKQKAYVDKRLKSAYKDQPGAEAIELMNIFSDGIIKGDITYDQTLFERLGNTIVNFFRSKLGLTTNEISFDDGRGVFNFLKEYNKSISEGKLSQTAIEAVKKAEVKKGAKVSEAQRLQQEQFSKTQLEGVKKRLSDIPAADVESRSSVNKISAELPAMIGTQINNRFANLDPDTREEFTFDVLEKILRPNKQGVNKDLQWDGRGDLYGFLNGRINLRIRDAVREDYNRPEAERMYVGRIDAKQLEDLTSEPSTEPTTEAAPKKKTTEESVQRGQAKFSELDIVDETLVNDIKTEIEKEIRVRAQKGTLSEMVGVKKGRETYMVTWLENYVDKQLFKKLSKKLGAIGERNGETVIPPAYIDFLQDAKTFDIITKALPIKSIKKSYGKLFEIERVGREETAEGNPIFRIKKIDKPKFFKYFVDGKKSTILERQKQLFREILTPIAKQAVADYATPENLAALNEIKELAPDTSLDVQAAIIIESQLMNLEDQLNRYKGEEKTFDVIQFSRNVGQQQKENIKGALTPLLDTPSNNDFKYSVVSDILNGLNNVKTYRDLADLVWNAGNTTLSVTSLREYRAELLSLLANRLNYTDTVKFLISAINKYQKVYKYQQKVIGYDYSLTNFKSDLAEAKGNKAKAKVAEDFLRYISRSVRTLKINDITKNSDVYNKIIKPVLSDPTKYGITLEIDKDKSRSYILKDGVRLQGLADVTRIKSDFAGSVSIINSEALEVRAWLLNEVKKAQANSNVDSFIGLLSLMSADQRGVIRKMNNAGFAFKNLKVADAVLEHETEAIEVFEEWKKFAEGKISEQQLNKFLDGAKVNLVPKGFDALLKKIQKETGARGKARYADPRAKAYLDKSKNNIIQFSRALPFPDRYDMVDVVSRALYPKETRVDAVIGGGVKPFEALPKELQRKVYQEMVDHKLTVEGIQFSQQNLSNVNKAKQMSSRPDAPNKGISVWDFDDTLATTKSNVLYTLPDGSKGKINATEFALRAGELEAQGAEFDFSEFSKVMKGAKGPMFDKAIARNKKFGNENVFILTARPANSKYAIHNFLKGIGLDIKLENIVGLGDGTAKAKAQWIIGKVAEGYNDFYFADDAYKNVVAVQEVLEQSDVKSKVHQAKVQFSKNLNKEFNKIIEDNTGIAAESEVSGAKAKVLARKKGRFKFFIPPSADDFSGLLYKLLGKGTKGEQQQAWFKQALFDPFAKAMREFESYKQNVATIVKSLKKDIKNIPAGLKKINSTGFTNETAVRVYLWVKNGYRDNLLDSKISNLTKDDIKDLRSIVENDPDLLDFADQIDAILDGYPEPQNDWLAGTITTDAINMINTVKRAEFLQEWQQNADIIFSQQNMNKLRAAFGDNYVEALQDMLYRMKTGRNRPAGANKLTNNFMNWVNDSVGTIMFFNTRSALLQTLSTVNFINWGDNNPMAAAKAFANQKQFWADFAMLFNSDFLKQRRSGLKNDVNADDIAAAAETATNKVKAALSSILKVGFLPTQIADSFAISLGGASFVRNRINSYVKDGMSPQEAQEKAFLDFQEIAEETQQSSRPDRISQQQASALGRIVLAFANTPMQYMRLTKKAFLDLKNRRGDAKTNITKIAYYMAVQNIIFSALQSALFATLFEDDDEEAIKEKELRVANSMLDSILRGVGVYGAAASTLKNIVLEIKKQSEKDRPDYTVAAQRALSISPPIDSKMRKLMSAARAFSYKTTREKMKGYGLDNPAYYAVGQVVSATTNIPLDRAIRKADNIRVAMDNDTKYWQSISLLLGYSQWDVGMVETSKDKKKKSKFGKTTNWKKTKPGSWKKKKD